MVCGSKGSATWWWNLKTEREGDKICESRKKNWYFKKLTLICDFTLCRLSEKYGDYLWKKCFKQKLFKINFLQKTHWTHVLITLRSGARGRQILLSLKCVNVLKWESRFAWDWMLQKIWIIRLLRLTSQNYEISHWVAYYDVKYNELNEAWIYLRCKELRGPDYSERATESPKSQTLLTFFKNIFVIQ